MRVNKKPYKFLQSNRNKRFIYLFGGASSSKSHTTGQYLVVDKAAKEKHIGILVVRKTRPAVKASCWPLVHRYLDEAKLPYVENKSDLIITMPGGNFFLFDGLDNIFKKKSLEGINYVWVEETSGLGYEAAITWKEFAHLDMICRANNDNGINQLFCSFNPVDPIGNAWLVARSEGKDADADNSACLRLTHKDNPFLADEEHARIEALMGQDPEYDKIYRLGEWATPTNLIYSNWDIVLAMPERYDESVWGLDFGYSGNPAALLEIRIVGNEIWEREHLYQTNLTNPQLIEMLKSVGIGRTDKIVADCAEPKSIQEVRNAGFNIHPCNKGKDSVRHGINTVKSFKVHVTADSLNLIMEKRGYKWKLDKDDNPLPEPVKFKDHLMDAERYAIAKVRTMVKAGLVSVGAEQERVEDIDNEELWTEI